MTDMAVTAANEAVEEVQAMTADLEGRLTVKDIVAWKEAVASYVRSYIFPRKQFVKDEEIGWKSVIHLQRMKPNGKSFGMIRVVWRWYAGP